MKIKKTTKGAICALLLVFFFLLSFNVSAKKELTYLSLTPTIKSASALNICIATLDQREVVMLGKQSSRFVGYIRSATMIAYPIQNSSDENFSEVMSTTIANALKQNGCTTSVMPTSYSNSKEDVVSELKTQEADIFVLVTMTKWRTDTKTMSFTKIATDLIYDLRVEIYNKSGELIASSLLKKEELDLSPMGSGSMKKIQAKVINPKYPEVMTKLFAIPEIEKALQ
jgi:hypothetical protein